MTELHDNICRYLSMIASGQLPEEKIADAFCSSELSSVMDKFAAMSVDIERLNTCNSVLVAQNQRIRDEVRLYRSIFENATVGIMILSGDGAITNVNRAVEYMFSYQAEELKLMNLSDITLPEDDVIDSELRQDLLEGRRNYYQIEKRYVRNDGMLFWGMVTTSVEWDESGTPSLIIMLEDISARKSAEFQMQEASTLDGLTGLYNRKYFDMEFSTLQYGMRLPVSIIVVDVDGLKLINDSIGHDAGDRLILGVATILKEAFRGDDIIARVGGDEFTILLPETCENVLETVLDRLHKCQARFNEAGPDFTVQFSSGYATAVRGEDMPAALKLADQRMYAEKKMHKGTRANPE